MGKALMPYHKDCLHWAGGPQCGNPMCICMRRGRYKLEPFLSYYGDTNMCSCENKERAEAWDAVCDAFEPGWVSRNGGSTGQESAVREVQRLRRQETLANQLAKELAEARASKEAWEGTAARRLNERNAQVDRAECAENNLQRELEKHTETLKMLAAERKTSDLLNATCVELQKRLNDAANPVTDGGYREHAQNVRRAAARYGTNAIGRSHPQEVAEAVHFLLQRVEQLEQLNKLGAKWNY